MESSKKIPDKKSGLKKSLGPFLPGSQKPPVVHQHFFCLTNSGGMGVNGANI